MKISCPYGFINDALPALIMKVHIAQLDGDIEQEIMGLIDTGAEGSVIPESLAVEMGLMPEGEMGVVGAGGEVYEERPTYFVTVRLNQQMRFELEVPSLPAEEHFLIGRDILNKLILHADGPAGVFELSRPALGNQS